ncbi:MAG: hypothetical protein HQL65_19875 [Magnetococcales bacterium]|nr:hypothetical protein [Magnetococcales bacterium]
MNTSRSTPSTPFTSITPFQFEAHVVRVVTRDGEPWFVAADVCAILEIGNVTNAMKRLDGDEQALYSIKGISTGNDQANIINESGFYSLVLRSDKPQAKPFCRWVTAEVLPSIRKTGQYVHHQPILGDLHSTPNIFTYTFENQQIRIRMIGGVPWFVAKDIAEALGHDWTDTKTIEHVPVEWRGIGSVPTPFANQNMAILSEPGMWFFLGRSDKPKAMLLLKKVAGEILPAICMTGRYDHHLSNLDGKEELRKLFRKVLHTRTDQDHGQYVHHQPHPPDMDVKDLLFILLAKADETGSEELRDLTLQLVAGWVRATKTEKISPATLRQRRRRERMRQESNASIRNLLHGTGDDAL